VLADAALSDRLAYALARGGVPEDLWVATRHGVNRLARDGAIEAYRDTPALPGAFGGEWVFDAMRDREGSLWFATIEHGVVMPPRGGRTFPLYRTDPSDPASLAGNRVTGLAAAADGAIWAVSLDGGIDRIDPASGRVERAADQRLAAPDKVLWSVLADRSGQLWVGYTRGLRVYDLQSGHFYDLPVDARRADALAPGLVYHLAEGADGAIWAVAYDSAGAVHRIDAKTHAVERFDAAAGLRNAEIDQIGFDAD